MFQIKKKEDPIGLPSLIAHPAPPAAKHCCPYVGIIQIRFTGRDHQPPLSLLCTLPQAPQLCNYSLYYNQIVSYCQDYQRIMYWSMTDCHTARPVRATVAWNASPSLRKSRYCETSALSRSSSSASVTRPSSSSANAREVFGSDVAVLHVDADVAESRLLLRVEQKISRNYVKSHNASSSPPLNGGRRRRS